MPIFLWFYRNFMYGLLSSCGIAVHSYSKGKLEVSNYIYSYSNPKFTVTVTVPYKNPPWSKRWFGVVGKTICKKAPNNFRVTSLHITSLYATLLPYSCTADWKIIASQYKYTHYQIISWMNNENLQKIRLSPHFLNIFVIHPEILW